MRNEGASQRAVEMTAETGALIGVKGPEFNLGIRQAVLLAMRVFVDVMRGVDDLKVCLLRNLTEVPFITCADENVASLKHGFESRWGHHRLHALLPSRC